MSRCRYRLVIGVMLFCITSTVFGASRFITGGSVKRTDAIATITIDLACQVQYLGHLPVSRGNRLRVQLEPTPFCAGVSPTVAGTREQYRPLNSDDAGLLEIDYDGELSSTPVLTFIFSDTVRYSVSDSPGRNRIIVQVHLDVSTNAQVASSGAAGVRVPDRFDTAQTYVLNLSSSRTPHTAEDRVLSNVSPGLSVFESEVVLAGVTWYRLRLGTFENTDAAEAELQRLWDMYPNAWIDRVKDGAAVPQDSVSTTSMQQAYASDPGLATLGLDQIDKLMADARRSMVAGEVSRSVQLYTKVLRAANHDRHAEAQELLGLAREKRGQTAHAKAEYQRYLALYPKEEGAARVQQRLAALLATGRQTSAAAGTATVAAGRTRAQPDEWRFNTFFSQYYRRDVNQLNAEDEIVSQSAMYSDVNFDARRRGERFDFSSRLSAGYRSDFLDETRSSGNQLRVSYAYADLVDTQTGLRGRIGRQSKNTHGILGRFDGFELGYRISERIELNTVIGQPVNSSTDGLDSERSFLGASVNYGPLFDDLELSMFVIQQEIGGIEDRQAVGTEFRYFGETQSLWGLVDFDTSYKELSSAYLQGSWRIGSRLTISASFNQRHNPYLSSGSAMIGQPVESFAEMLILWSEDEIRQLSLDRAPLASSYTSAVSYSLSPRLQLSVDVNQTTIDATPESGGVAATPESTYNYFSSTLIASSLFKEGDVFMLGLRHSKSESTEVTSLSIDSRFPLGRRWRINPRLRVDQRSIISDGSDELLYTPGLRIQYRHNRRFRVDLEAGKQFASRDVIGGEIERESYFVNLGYQAFF
jgi:tetratricopeptide (TPR) repeat protein